MFYLILNILATQRHSLDSIVDRLKVKDNRKHVFNQRINKSTNKKLVGNVIDFCLNGNSEKNSSISADKWPKTIELSFDGFYDSEKELDWVTVDVCF